MTAAARNSTIGGAAVLVLLMSSLLVVASAVLFYAWSATQVSIAEEQHAVAELKLAAKEHAQKKADAETTAKLEEWNAENKERARQDRLAEDLGYTVLSRGFYIKHEEDGQCTEESACAMFSALTDDACASGVALTISMFYDNGTRSTTHSITEGLPAGGIARMNVGMPVEATKYRVEEARCMG